MDCDAFIAKLIKIRSNMLKKTMDVSIQNKDGLNLKAWESECEIEGGCASLLMYSFPGWLFGKSEIDEMTFKKKIEINA